MPEEEGMVDDDANPEKAIEQINRGLEKMRDLFVEHEAEEQYEQDELVVRLNEFRESIRENYGVGMTLQERIDKAIENENYEEAAQLRDQLDQGNEG
jgi:excinuclease UvrABC helicase subunit UvrB